MASFFDADKFMFVMMDSGHLTPVHYRDLGEKEGYLYSKKVSWADATINKVPLEQTFRYEDEITHVEDSVGVGGGGVIIVNERRGNQLLNDGDQVVHRGEKWMKRLEKTALNPISVSKKKKNGSLRFPVKPKCKKEVRDAAVNHSSCKFQELVDKKSLGIVSDYIYTFNIRDGYKEIVGWDDGDDFGNNVKREVRYQPLFKEKTYCPPEHWLTPVVQWEKIWTEMDTIEYGYKRDYVYVPEGELCPESSSIMGPAIYFFEPNYYHSIEDYEKEWINAKNKRWITARRDYAGGNRRSRINWLEIPEDGRLSNASYLSRVEKAYLENPSKGTFEDYQDGWRLTQPGYQSHYQSGNDGWKFKVYPLSTSSWTVSPHPHL